MSLVIQKNKIVVGQSVNPVVPDRQPGPAVVTTPTRSLEITRVQFRKLFTLEERMVIDNAQYNPAFTGSVKAAIATMQKDMEVSATVDLYLPDTIAGVNYLVSVGVLNAVRAERILSNLPPV
ncbi:MAG: hypothetical protein AUJ56_07310 [Zetaproteobacteria bacterium CG1_02_49_23]|nr:MAG: hypothetical protein AUJ56_07310 [Zetaproteobacteria bacterium CG1_02_49_23]